MTTLTIADAIARINDLSRSGGWSLRAEQQGDWVWLSGYCRGDFHGAYLGETELFMVLDEAETYASQGWTVDGWTIGHWAENASRDAARLATLRE